MVLARIKYGCMAAALAVSLGATAAQNGELWEVSSQMNIPGMPAGMGAQKVTVCKGPKDEVARDPQASKCKVTDVKKSANRVTVSMSCPEGDATMDYRYNAAHTEYEGTMHMVQRGREMTMNMTGRKLGSCDANNPQDTRAKANAQAAQIQTTLASESKASARRCEQALQNMDAFGIEGVQGCNPSSEQYKAMMQNPLFKDEVATCCRITNDFCKRYQTRSGFLQVKDKQLAATKCAVSYAKVKAPFCAESAKAESLDLNFVGAYCPEETKALVQSQCAGRDYTAVMKSKYGKFCQDHYAFNSEGDSGLASDAGQGGAAKTQSSGDSAKALPTSVPALPDPAQAVNQGINKLKGLFGH